jgi:16S rRNA (cytosine967-C5)-methyltransferase
MAFDLLVRWRRSRVLADELLDERLEKATLSIADRALATELFYGCLRNRLALEHLLSQVSVHKPRTPVATILQLGLYQIFFLNRIPAHAAVHESVELAKRHASTAEAKFVNAALRRASSERDGLAAKLRATLDSEPWIYHSHPRWLWERWQSRLGRQEALALCEWNNTVPPVYVRLNTLKVTSPLGADFIRDYSRSRFGIAPANHDLCFRVNDPAGLFDSPAWKGGEFYVQDPSTLLAVDVLDPRPGETVLDLCAAPGGKTTYIAQKMENRGEIVAADSSSSRLGLVGENCRRLGVKIVSTIACEGTRLDRCLRRTGFDRVLVDAPCSNTGVLRRRADLRWRLDEKEIERLAALQFNLLGAASHFTGTGGTVVYSTCSLEPEENERVVERFCEAHPQFTLETTRSTFPPRDGVDGAFVARFRCR